MSGLLGAARPSGCRSGAPQHCCALLCASAPPPGARPAAWAAVSQRPASCSSAGWRDANRAPGLDNVHLARLSVTPHCWRQAPVYQARSADEQLGPAPRFPAAWHPPARAAVGPPGSARHSPPRCSSASQSPSLCGPPPQPQERAQGAGAGLRARAARRRKHGLKRGAVERHARGLERAPVPRAASSARARLLCCTARAARRTAAAARTAAGRRGPAASPRAFGRLPASRTPAASAPDAGSRRQRARARWRS